MSTLTNNKASIFQPVGLTTLSEIIYVAAILGGAAYIIFLIKLKENVKYILPDCDRGGLRVGQAVGRDS
jgi:hypothetical protein